MDRRYEVEVPIDKGSQFEETIQELGGKILRKRRRAEEIKAEARKRQEERERLRATHRSKHTELWYQQIQPAKILIEKFEQEKNPRVNNKINQGITKLIRDAFHYSYLPQGFRLRDQIPIDELKQALVAMFKKLTSETMPNTVFPRSIKNKVAFQTRSDDLLPKEVIVLIERYGLADGIPKLLRAISEKYGIHYVMVGQTTNSVLYKIRQNPIIREITLEKRPYKTW